MRGLKCGNIGKSDQDFPSHPSRVRGLKCPRSLWRGCILWVAPLAGAWIEISGRTWNFVPTKVAPLAGAWIEIKSLIDIFRRIKSHPSRVRGLKSSPLSDQSDPIHVAPLAGAWIEIKRSTTLWISRSVAPLAGAWIEMITTTGGEDYGESRTPRGCVD